MDRTLSWLTTYHSWVVLTVAVIIAAAHVWQLGSLPRGLYLDESSTGYNAWLIAHTGRDEHGEFFPTFFKAFGEYKSPVLTYTAAALIFFFGVSEFTIRLASALLFSLFLIGLYLLARLLFPKNSLVSIYWLVAAGFLPWFFTISRVVIDTIAQPTITIFALIFLFLAYHHPSTRHHAIYGWIAGFVAGMSIYTYATARLLTLLFLCGWALIYIRRSTLKTAITYVAGAATAYIPYIWFALSHPGALTTRFKTITYIYDPNLTFTEKIVLFIKKYTSYFNFDFLLLNAPNPGLFTTYLSGQISVAVAVLWIAGLLWLVQSKKIFQSKFIALISLDLITSPAAAALSGTIDEPPHGSRSILLGMYIVIISAYGLMCVIHMQDKRQKSITLGTLAILLLWQNAYATWHYFTIYPPVSITEFQSYDFKKALERAHERHPQKIQVSPQLAIHAHFYNAIIQDSKGNGSIPIIVSESNPSPNSCLIYSRWHQPIIDAFRMPFTELVKEDVPTKARCY